MLFGLPVQFQFDCTLLGVWMCLSVGWSYGWMVKSNQVRTGGSYRGSVEPGSDSELSVDQRGPFIQSSRITSGLLCSKVDYEMWGM